jgi:hypothetical protein
MPHKLPALRAVTPLPQYQQHRSLHASESAGSLRGEAA